MMHLIPILSPLFLLLFSFHFLLIPCQASPVLLYTRQGPVRGLLFPSGNQAFFNLPYAIPPLGTLRFQPPLPAPPLASTLDATSRHVRCPQPKGGAVEGEEDCLVLNLYTPYRPAPPGSPLPVMVYVHGGSFTSGSGAEDSVGPWLLVESGVILIAVNYRLGVLGGLTTGTMEAPGNLGLRDILLALTWVRENVADFGGDPGRITLFGESAGSMAISALLASPALEEGLVRRVILQSGTMVRNMEMARSRDNMAEYARTVGEGLGCGVEDLVECLQAASVEDLVGMTYLARPARAWEPWVDASLGEGAVLPRSTLQVFRAGTNRRVEVIVGTNSGDGWLYGADLFTDPEAWGQLALDWLGLAAGKLLGRIEPTLEVRWEVAGANYQGPCSS